MNMIEKVARASYDKYFENLIGCCEPPFDKLEESHKFRLMESARAAIEAMREPTKSMIVAANKPSGQMTYGDVYTTMIDAALKE